MTIWVCVDCMLHYANGECGSCHDDGHDEEPLSLLTGQDFAMGGEHSEECEGEDCDCETDIFSRSQCEGCGSWLHGERHAFTIFEPKPRNRTQWEINEQAREHWPGSAAQA
jgi:hypothetical protein